jgi:carbon-monoxide dehydrogenase large subunit
VCRRRGSERERRNKRYARKPGCSDRLNHIRKVCRAPQGVPPAYADFVVEIAKAYRTMSTTTLTDASQAARTFLAGEEARIDGEIKVRGEAIFTADCSREGMLWAAFAESPYPRAKIVSIDTTAALAVPGVRAVLTGQDIGERRFGNLINDWPVLAYGEVTFIGEFVAAVAAETREAAVEAATLLDVTYEELPAQLNAVAAIEPDAPLTHPNVASFVYAGPPRPPLPHPNMQGYELHVKGDPDAVFATADRVFERTFTTPRYHAGYIEPRATLVWFDGAGVLHVISSHKGPFKLRDIMAQVLEVDKDHVIVEPSYIGGEFGAKGLAVEAPALAFLARATGRPVKHVRTYLEDVRSSHVRHASTTRVRLATSNDGMMLALDFTTIFDGGAYGAHKPAPGVLPGRPPKLPYDIADMRMERAAVYTNTVPAAFLRAPGDLQIIFALESMTDIVAHELRIDPLEFRLKNAIADGDTDIEGSPVTESRSREVLVALREAMHWGEPLPAGRSRGMALSARHISGGATSFLVTVQPEGGLAVHTGAVEPGVGQHTVIQRVLAAELGIDSERITVTRGNTRDVPLDPGIGGSRGTNILSHAALDAAQKVRALFAEAGVDHLSWNDAVRAVTKNGPVTVTGAGSSVHTPGHAMYLNFGAYGADVSIDADTGTVKVHEIVFVADVGQIINPIAHKGQIDGGFLMGLGSALTEEIVLEDGRIVNPALSDYKLPCQRDMPPFRVIQLPPTGGPGAYGAKAAGEFNTAGVAPAIANAIEGACGVRLTALGITSERIYDALHHLPQTTRS